jgi:hypothetical protein
MIMRIWLCEMHADKPMDPVLELDLDRVSWLLQSNAAEPAETKHLGAK